MDLFFRESGQGPALIILHGLFGSSDNWYTVAKSFSPSYKVYLIDQRNHGQSPHSDDFNYKLLTEDLREFFTAHKISSAIVIGHSMGGKTAMNFAVRYPDLVDRLIVVDIVPKSYRVHHDRLVEGMQSLPVDRLQSRTEADTLLAKNVPDLSERQFLLKNLVREPEGGFHWKLNLTAVDNHLEEIGAGMQYDGKFEKPSFFIRGKHSNYYKPGDEDLIRTIFPAARFLVLDTGHWVQAEKPAEFVQSVLEFLKS